jgi:CopG family nickel-responsive transcriptional regulator
MSDETQAGVDRFGVSLPEGLLGDFDAMVKQKGYDNRSLAIADMIRAELVEHRQNSGNREIAGSITLVYDHHKSSVQQALTQL